MTAFAFRLLQRQRLAASMAFALVMILVLTPFGLAAPNDDDIKRAQAEEEAAKMSVARIEVELANVASQTREAQTKAAIAAEKYNGSRVALDEATKAADKAQEEAREAHAEYEQGRRDIASVVQTAYRSGGTGLDSFAPYLEADGLRQVESRQNSLEAVGDAASQKMQRVAALEQVARVMQTAADKAKELQEKATAEVEAQASAAQAAANELEEVQHSVELRREVLYEELARKQNTTVELIKEKERVEAEERARAEAEEARRAAEERARRLEEQRREDARRAAEEAAAEEDEDDYYTPTPAPRPAPAPNANKAQGAIDAAMQMLGAAYVWGGEGPQDGGYDCSGLVMMAYRTQGIYLDHWSVSQYRYGANGGAYVPLSQAEPGDLVFWSSNGSASGVYHVALYIGGGRIIEAATFGVPARITSLYNRWSMMPYAVRVV